MLDDVIQRLRSARDKIGDIEHDSVAATLEQDLGIAIRAIKETRWIPCTEQMPPCEMEVQVCVEKKRRDGTVDYLVRQAFYEDGTLLESDSEWCWCDLDGEYNEEDCYYIPEGWWEYCHYLQDDVYINPVDDKVVAWKPLPRAVTVPYLENEKGGWIDASDEKSRPEEFKDVLIWFEYFRYGEYNRMFQTYGIGYWGSNTFHLIDGGYTKFKALAWRPLPEKPEFLKNNKTED